MVVWKGVWYGGLIGPFFTKELSTMTAILTGSPSGSYLSCNKSKHFRKHKASSKREVRRWSTEASLSVECDSEDRFTGLLSPDLSICDYWLWGDLNRRVYDQQPANLPKLQDRIRQEVTNISAETRLKVLMDFPRRLRDHADKASAYIE